VEISTEPRVVESEVFVPPWMNRWIIFYITLLTWEFLLKWYSFETFVETRVFLLCTTIFKRFEEWNFIPLLKIRCPKVRSWSLIFYLRLRNPDCTIYLSYFLYAWFPHVANKIVFITTQKQYWWDVNTEIIRPVTRESEAPSRKFFITPLKNLLDIFSNYWT